MFHKTIHIKSVSEIRYGHTRVSYEQTYGQIMALLRKHGCDKIATMRDETTNSDQFAFEYNKNTYVFTVPRVYLKGKFDEKIGIRIVLYFLETLLELTKNRVVDIEFLMLGSRMVETEKGTMTLKQAADRLPPKAIFKDMVALPEGEPE